MFCHFHQGLMAVPDYFGIYLEAVKGFDGCLAVGKNMDGFTCVALFCVIHYQALMVYISAWNTVVLNPQLKLFFLLEPYLYA